MGRRDDSCLAYIHEGVDYLKDSRNVSSTSRVLWKYRPGERKRQCPLIFELVATATKADEVRKSSDFKRGTHDRPEIICHYDDHWSSWTVHSSMTLVNALWLDKDFKR